MKFMSRDFTYAPVWNLFLITTGALIQAIAFKAIGTAHGFVPIGLFGVATIIEYQSSLFDAGTWYLILNIPMFILGYLFISKRFLIYSFVAMMIISLAYMVVDFEITIRDQLYAAVVFGVMIGAGAGIVLRSLGSNGGLDVVAIILHQRYNIGIGKTFFIFNFLLFSYSFGSLDNDLVIASLIAAFVTSVTVEYCLSMFSQRKLCFVISNTTEAIADEIREKLGSGSTILNGTGSFRREQRPVLMVVTNNIQLKRLEEIVFTRDPNAMMIVENTFSVIGSSFSRRKIY